MKKLVLLRHGESVWNKENRFTGWTDVGLTAQGEREAREAGRLMREAGLGFDLAHTSVLKRAIKTLWLALEEMDLMWIPVANSWRLNERHYGALQGLNKAEMAAKFGEAQVQRLAAELRRAAAAARGRRPAQSRGRRPALPRDRAGRPAAHRVPEGHGRAVPALLERVDRAGRGATAGASSSRRTATACARW